jgi:RHS repeat-associated protein
MRVVQAVVNGPETLYLLDGNQVVTDAILNGPTNQTLYGPGTDHALARNREFFLPNSLGSTTALTNSGGSVTQSYSYGPFGNLLNSPTDSNPFQFTGRENDGQGLLYYRARYYNPAWGRFVSADPIGFEGGINPYVYAGNNPINRTDPSGEIASTLGPSWPYYYHGPTEPRPWDYFVANTSRQAKDLGKAIAGWAKGVGHRMADDVRNFGDALLGALLPAAPLPGGNITIEVPRSRETDIIDEFIGGRPTRPLLDRQTGAVAGEMTTDAGPTRRVIYGHTDPGTPQWHINLHDDATGTNIHVILN